MDFYNFLKSFLGIPNSVPPNDFGSSRFGGEDEERYRSSDERIFDGPHRNDDDPMGFRIFSEPLEMHRYFERQMNEVLRAFGADTSDGSFFGHFGDFFGERPAIEAAPRQSPGDLRDQFLKPGFESAPQDAPRSDSDLDGKVDIKDLDTLLEEPVTPYRRPPPMQRGGFFGQSMMSKTITRADGTVETHRTVRDNEGNEETTVTYRQGDKEYTVVTKTDKSGKQEREEKLLNIDKADVGRLLPPPDAQGPSSPFGFDRFFRK